MATVSKTGSRMRSRASGQVDVTIMGAGIFGLSIGWACARRGARVRVIDPHGIGAGASGGLVGALSPHTPDAWNAKKAAQLESLLMAADWWAGVAQGGGGDPGYGQTGRLQPVADARALALATERGWQAAELWQGRATWEVIPVAAAGGWAPPSASGWLIRDTLSARLHPRRALAALARALQAHGAEIVTGADADPDPYPDVALTGASGTIVRTATDDGARRDLSGRTGPDAGTREIPQVPCKAPGLAEDRVGPGARPDRMSSGADAGRVLWATGAAGLAGLPGGGAAEKGQAALLGFDARRRPQLFVEGLHLIPHADGTLAVGSTSERDWDDPTGTDDRLDGLIARARQALPALARAPVLERWAGLRPRSATRAPILGAHPLHPGAFIANGGFKIGFGMAPWVAEVMADLLLDGQDRIPPEFRA